MRRNGILFKDFQEIIMKQEDQENQEFYTIKSKC